MRVVRRKFCGPPTALRKGNSHFFNALTTHEPTVIIDVPDEDTNRPRLKEEYHQERRQSPGTPITEIEVCSAASINRSLLIWAIVLRRTTCKLVNHAEDARDEVNQLNWYKA